MKLRRWEMDYPLTSIDRLSLLDEYLEMGNTTGKTVNFTLHNESETNLYNIKLLEKC